MLKNNQSNKPNNPLIELIITIIIPTVIMMKLSSKELLGPINALIVALAFPFLYLLVKLLQEKKINFVALFGIISILLTGGIGILKLNTFWVPIKEAIIPLMIGIVVVFTRNTKYGLGRLMSRHILNQELLKTCLDDHNKQNQLNTILEKGTLIIASSFLLSCILNFILAKHIVISPSGTEAFTQELGKLTALSFPVISIPCMIVSGIALFYILNNLKKLLGVTLEQLMKSQST